MHLSKNQIKLITSLQTKKYRNKYRLFVAEGTKVVHEYLNSKFVCEQLFCVDETGYEAFNFIKISSKELKKISTLKSPNNVLALFKIPTEDVILKEKGLILVLDTINDPGNLGTIIRLCDWFNVSQLVCSKDTVDCFSPKVIQASMGSLSRLSIVYTDLTLYLKQSKLPKYATAMGGVNVYKQRLPKDAILIMGNEANGISYNILEEVSNTLAIPKFGRQPKTESLNVATATAILLSEFKRNI